MSSQKTRGEFFTTECIERRKKLEKENISKYNVKS